MSHTNTKKQPSTVRIRPQKQQSIHRRSYEMIRESDSTYLLKLVIYVILATLWLKFNQTVTWLGLPLTAFPLGLLLGLILVRTLEKLQEDRKIWYAVIIIVGIISYFVPAGIVL